MNAPIPSPRFSFFRIATAVLLVFVSLIALIDHIALSRLTTAMRPRGNDVSIMQGRLAKVEGELDSIVSAPFVSNTRFDAAQEAIRAEIAQIQQVVENSVRRDEVTATNDRLSAIETRMATLRQPRAPQPRLLEEVTITGKRESITAPFTVLGIEFVGGESFISLAPIGATALKQVRMLRVGETYEDWQLEQLDNAVAEFRINGRTIKIALPTESSK